MKLYATTALALALGTGAAQAQQTEVNILRVQPGDDEQVFYSEVERAYEAEHPDVDVVFEYIANEAYKSKLPTLLQSDARPDLFYSWGGETLREQAEAGFLRPIGDVVSEDVLSGFPQAALEAYTVDGSLYGLPLYATEVIFWVNTELTEQAGVDHESIETWDDFLQAVQTLKDAGVTPIIAGGQDKWPLHFYWSYLALREGGPDVVTSAMEGGEMSFESEAFVAAGEDLVELAEMDPFQPGVMGTTYETASGMFADGEGAFHLMGDWDYLPMRGRATDGEGLSDEQLAIMAFPTISDPVTEGGANATLGGINGWAVTADASEAAVDFLTFMLNRENQETIAERGIFIPIVKGADQALQNAFFQRVATDISESDYHQIFLDQFLGASVGATVNDVSADLVAGATTPEEAAARVQEAWDFR
ncbi:raffinose/stachyose/melibiose transport system substrate-binding protein [Palleronia marisminoris]|uniref:Putative arabinose-binding protein n=1 Tax=Palleronia marisminoris TaxID=315423 RepID=A0A1Y5TP61_9RHOB|nr:extracellular solute-binding protein [Palleronia marisminoris]SFH47240.1 raffinose/stachyose/melibiose transport system substrate-binding protein [Palleronia marisminoris]SLN68611.1 putative arabinose-binding protein precursor [Palleronia marisminoris]